MQDKRPKGHVDLVTKKNKTRFGALWWNHWGDFPPFFMCVHTVVHTYIPGFIEICSGLRAIMEKKTFRDPTK